MPAYGPRRPKAVAGAFETLSEDQARRCIAYVNRGRQLLAERVRSLVLFGPRRNVCKKNDHPMVQVLYELRNKYEGIAKRPDADSDQDLIDTQVNILTKMFQFSRDLTQEGNKASVEIQQMLHARIEMRQRQKEHEDKMELARKAGGSDLFTVEELSAAAGEAPGSQVIPWSEKRDEVEGVEEAPKRQNALGPIDITEDTGT